MSKPYSKADCVIRLKEIQDGVSASVRRMTREQFFRERGETWSAAGYLKHLILSVKPLAKAFETLSPQKMEEMFGTPDRPSRGYDEVVADYEAQLAGGFRAENSPSVLPDNYRLPDDVGDEHTYLVETWEDGNQRLLAALENWPEESLDRYQLPHPATGMQTLREFLLFTLYHNTIHWRDIQNAG